MQDAIHKLIDQLRNSFTDNTFVKMTVSNYTGTESDLERIYIRPVEIKSESMLSFTYRYKTKDITKNYSQLETLTVLKNQLESFRTAHLFTTTSDITFDKERIKTSRPTFKEAADTGHDKKKQRVIDPKAKFLYKLGITTINGQVKSDRFDKYKQINKFIEAVESLYQSSSLSSSNSLNILDLGSGKSYLTFALYHYFHEVMKKDVEVQGVELRKELVELSNEVAHSCEYQNLKFIKSSIENFSAEKADIVVALHACDTATDDAIMKAVDLNAEIIILSPCCHKYVRKQEKSTLT